MPDSDLFMWSVFFPLFCIMLVLVFYAVHKAMSEMGSLVFGKVGTVYWPKAFGLVSVVMKFIKSVFLFCWRGVVFVFYFFMLFLATWLAVAILKWMWLNS